MTRRAAAWLAWSLWALCVAIYGAALLLLTVVDPSRLPEQLLFVPAALGYITVGALIATRRPENAIGWLFCAIPPLALFGLFAEQYFLYAVVVRPGALPAAAPIGWLGNWLGALGWVGLWTFTLLLFPTGRLPSARWRPIAWAVGAAMALYTASTAFQPGPLNERAPDVPNPAGLDAFAGLLTALEESDWVFLLVIGLCAASVLARFRAARGVERQQLKWFAYAAGVVALVFGLEMAVLEKNAAWIPSLVGDTLPALAGVAVPAAIGVAILRHRLLDIDVIIKRTLVYALLTGALAAVYLGSVVLLQQSFRALTGQDSDLAIVAATLAIAALFQPLRRLIQSVIDRRFYRRRYDPALVLAAHRAAVRDEVDVERLTAALVRAADETMRPAHASLWLRAPEEAPR
jgi:hypothetical protein